MTGTSVNAKRAVDPTIENRQLAESLPLCAKMMVYLVERLGLPIVLLLGGGFFFVDHLKDGKRHLDGSTEAQMKNAEVQGLLAKGIRESREESRAQRAVLEQMLIFIKK